EQRVAADQIQRVVGDVETEHVRKNQRLQQHHQQRVEDAPQITEEAAPVFDFEVPRDQFPDQRTVFFEVPPAGVQLAGGSLWHGCGISLVVYSLNGVSPV